jgi:hypothetical protein
VGKLPSARGGRDRSSRCPNGRSRSRGCRRRPPMDTARPPASSRLAQVARLAVARRRCGRSRRCRSPCAADRPAGMRRRRSACVVGDERVPVAVAGGEVGPSWLPALGGALGGPDLRHADIGNHSRLTPQKISEPSGDTVSMDSSVSAWRRRAAGTWPRAPVRSSSTQECAPGWAESPVAAVARTQNDRHGFHARPLFFQNSTATPASAGPGKLARSGSEREVNRAPAPGGAVDGEISPPCTGQAVGDVEPRPVPSGLQRVDALEFVEDPTDPLG